MCSKLVGSKLVGSKLAGSKLVGNKLVGFSLLDWEAQQLMGNNQEVVWAELSRLS